MKFIQPLRSARGRLDCGTEDSEDCAARRPLLRGPLSPAVQWPSIGSRRQLASSVGSPGHERLRLPLPVHGRPGVAAAAVKSQQEPVRSSVKRKGRDQNHVEG